jgi:ABC-2 type transport system permease protein
MRNLIIAFGVETMKLKHSKILWLSILFYVFVPLMMGLLMLVAQHPDVAAKMGIVGTKATFFGQNNWVGFLTQLGQTIASVGLIGFGFVSSWVFGREYIERTLVDIVALPLPRKAIVDAKLLVILVWGLLLSFVLYVVGIFIGLAEQIPGWSAELISTFTKNYIVTLFLTLAVCTPIAWLASYSKGILAPLGFVFLALISAQFSGLMGLGPYFPYAIPGLNSVSANVPGMVLNSLSYIIVLITGLAGYLATHFHWQKADIH